MDVFLLHLISFVLQLPCYVAPVYNASSPFNDINRCDTELQQLECHLPKLKLCVAVKNEGSLMAVCTYNICLTGKHVKVLLHSL